MSELSDYRSKLFTYLFSFGAYFGVCVLSLIVFALSSFILIRGSSSLDLDLLGAISGLSFLCFIMSGVLCYLFGHAFNKLKKPKPKKQKVSKHKQDVYDTISSLRFWNKKDWIEYGNYIKADGYLTDIKGVGNTKKNNGILERLGEI